MKIFGFKPKDIFLKNDFPLLSKEFFNASHFLKIKAGNNRCNTFIFQKYNKVSKSNSGSNGHKFNKDNRVSRDNGSILLKLILKVFFFLILVTAVLILCFLPIVFNISEAQAMPSSPLIVPLQGEFNVKFRQEYFDGTDLVTRKHTGIDIAGEPGEKVRASGNGSVIYTGFSATGGRTVVIKHNEKIRSTYLNILDCFVNRGEIVSQGDIIANIGADDDPSLEESHLHFGIIYVDSYLDPEDVLDIDYNDISRFISLEYINPDTGLKINRN